MKSFIQITRVNEIRINIGLSPFCFDLEKEINDDKQKRQKEEVIDNNEERSCIQQMKDKWKEIFDQIKNFSFF